MRTTFQKDAAILEKKTWPVEKLADLSNEELLSLFNKDKEKQISLAEYFYKKSDIQRVAFWLHQAGCLGSTQSQYNYGMLLLRGNGVEKNPPEAIVWLTGAAKKECVEAQYELSVCFKNGIGTEKNEKLAFDWCYQSANAGYAKAQVLLGYCYLEGLGTVQDYQQAVAWFSKAAANKNIDAYFRLGLCYLRGMGVTLNKEKAIKYFKIAVQGKHIEAHYYLADCLMKGIGIEKNAEEAAQLLRKIAQQSNYPLAQNWVNKKIGFLPDFILEQAIDSKESGLPDPFPPPFYQIGPYCGLAAFAAAINYSGCLSYPVYATAHEKKLAGKGDCLHETQDILFEQLKHFIPVKEKWRTEEGEIYNVKLFSQLANHYGIHHCEVILKEDYTQEEYQAALLGALKENKMLVVACESTHGVLAYNQGKTTHWVLVPGYWVDKDNIAHVIAMHHHLYAKWSVEDLFKCNQQIPIENPNKLDGHLKKFRYSLFSVPVIAAQAMQDKNNQKDNALLNAEDPVVNINDDSLKEKMLAAFWQAYDKQYQSEFFSNPFSKMKNQRELFTSIEEIEVYAKAHPETRSAKVLKKMQDSFKPL
ncbi:MAG: sel1 repeat family protein [Gammaproteobacteria bacterium]|nr:sel1 repeat family protein [Gammaproteobacteria bacterium]